MNIAQAKCIPIDDYLQKQGLSPVSSRHAGQELWYHSPIREGDENPSFKVNTIKNLWFDHGAARGGTLLDLVCELCSCDVRDALAHLDKTGLYSTALATPTRENPSASQKIGASASRNNGNASKNSVSENLAGEKEKSGALELVSQSKLKHPALLDYLRKRAINIDVAQKYCAQIDFKRSESFGSYFGLGYPSGEGFEVRNALFKGYVGVNKNVSFHDCPNSDVILVFEGFMDFLSYLTLKKQKEHESAILVLNSTNLWRKALPYIEDPRFKTIQLFLDNDDAGNAATQQIMDEISNSTNEKPAQTLQDMREHYENFKDLNDFLLSK